MLGFKKKVSLNETLCDTCKKHVHVLKTLSKPLHEAAKGGHVECMKALMQAGADVNKKDYLSWTPLMNAAANGHVDCVRLLIEAGADLNKQDQYGWTALIRAAFNGRNGSVKLLLEAGADVNRQDKDGHIALMYATEYGHFESVITLIEAGANVNYREKNYGGTPLKSAANGGHADCVKALIEGGADVNEDKKLSLLTLASKEGHVDCARLLVKIGADVNGTDEDGNTPLGIAAMHGKVGCVKFLLGEGADVNALDMNYNTSLVSAAIVGCINCEYTRILLLAGVKINRNGNALRKHISSEQRTDRDACLLLFAAGEITNGYSRFCDRYVLEFIRVSVLNYALPEDLKHLCRETIRKHLISIDPHQHLFGRIPQLGLPSSLEKYLLYNMSLDDESTTVAASNSSNNSDVNKTKDDAGNQRI